MSKKMCKICYTDFVVKIYSVFGAVTETDVFWETKILLKSKNSRLGTPYFWCVFWFPRFYGETAAVAGVTLEKAQKDSRFCFGLRIKGARNETHNK